jgi:SAM-dependent methyltransferase
MRALRVLLTALVVLLAGWAIVSLLAIRYIVHWMQERHGGGGPMPFSEAEHLVHPLRRWIHPAGATLERFRLETGDTVLELGPGPGYFTIEASGVVGAAGRVLCLDIQPEMIRMLGHRLEEYGITNAHPLVGDALNLPLADKSVDAAFLVAVLGEIPDRPRALAELRRVMRPGGVLSFMETLTDPDYMFKDSLGDLCRASGFDFLDEGGQFLGYTMCFTSP